MSIFKCKMCGGTIEFEQGATVGVCDSCGTKQTLPRLDDDRRVNLYDRANHFRRNNEFDKAAGIYEQILTEDTTDAEAYWSLVLCQYGIEYVEDPATHKRVPTVNRAQFTSIFDDDNYKSALRYADGYQRELYENEAKTINDIQKGILAISQKEEPFDVFICYKETDPNGRRTPDSVLATDLYHGLTQEGFKVFFSRITLEDKLGTAYEPYIFAALNSSKVMVVLGTKPEHFNAVWVKNEWSRYLALVKKSGGKKILIPAYKDMDPYDLPEEFSHLQAQDMSKLGFMQDLIRGIKKIVGETEPRTAVKETVVVGTGNANVAPLLKRAFLFLEDGEWDEADAYCEKVLDQDPENAEAYLGKLMAELHVRRQEELENCKEPFDGSNNYQKAVRFGDAAFAETVKNLNKARHYNSALRAMNTANSEETYKSAAKAFKTIPGFKDADALAEQCLDRAEKIKEWLVSTLEAMAAAAKSHNSGTAGISLQRQLESARADLLKLETLHQSFDSKKAELQSLQNESDETDRLIKALQDERATLGLFAHRRKKEIDAEIQNNSERKTIAERKSKTLVGELKGFQTKESLESQIQLSKNRIFELEERKNNTSAALSYPQALRLYWEIKSVRQCFISKYPDLTEAFKTFEFGRYWQSPNSAPAPIEWIILDSNEAGKILLLSKYALDSQAYNTSYIPVTWETCSLRKWLNSTFFNNAFSKNEQKLIQSTTVTTDDYSSSNNTTDKVFLLSIREVDVYFDSDSARQCQGTAYCYAKGAYEADGGNCLWWLRSPGPLPEEAVNVDDNGSVDFDGCIVDFDRCALRPALWVNLDAVSSIKANIPSRITSAAPDGITLFATAACPKCRVVMTMLENQNLPYTKKLVEENEEEARALGLRQAPTLIVTKNGESVKYETMTDIREYLNNL